MAIIPLRAYNREIEGMIDTGQIDEAIAHCRYILQSFPKHIATYRLLGKAFLEDRRYSDASDILQRVLSSLPDDFVSNVGMSIIREDESNLDAAIWHMERAFEAQPANAAIQEELRRLYGRRDGLEPPKVRLTRGALARMYSKGDLFDQAIAETRAALADDPQRPDLQILLAQMYYQSGQKAEAIDTCSALIKKLPYCMEANRILSIILPQTERAEDSQVYLQRVVAMDPYYSKAAPQAFNSDDVADNAVTIERLVYHPGEALTGAAAQPSWAASLGIAFEDTDKEQLPEWLQEGEAPALTTGAKPTAVSPFSWEVSEEEKEPAQPAPEGEALIPEWMKEAGWQPSSEETQEGPAPLEIEEPSEPAEGEIARAEIPDWLKDMAPSGVLEEEVPSEEETGEAILPWLQETPPGPTDTIVSWLEEQKGIEQAPTEAKPPESMEAPEVAASAPPIPDWLKELEEPAAQEAATELQPPIPPQPEEAAGPELPDWLQGAEESAEDQSGVTDWLRETTAVGAAGVVPGEELTTEKSEELPEWLEEIGEEAPGEPSGSSELFEAAAKEEAPEILAPTAEEAAAPVAAEEIPDWLREMAPAEAEAAPPEEAVVEEPAAEAEEIPEWLREMAPAEAEVAPPEVPAIEAAPPAAPEVPSAPDLTDQDAALAWLESLAAQHGAKEEELITPPAERLETPPEWVRETVEPEEALPPAQPPAVAPTEEEAEIPEWLREMTPAEAEVAPPEEPVVEEPVAEAEEIPEWLREMAPAEAEVAPPEVPAVEAVPPAAPEAPSAPDLTDQDAALAWLEGLAAQHGAKEEELITPPAERLETPPEWVREAVEPEEALPPAQPPAAAPTEEEAEIPEWLREMTPAEAEVAPPEVPVVEEPVEAVEEEIPEWLREMAPTEAEVAPAEVPVVEEPVEAVEEEIPEWLRAIAPTEIEKPAPAEVVEEIPSALVNVNTASLSELEKLPGIGFVLAQSIMAYRDTHGPFTSIDDLVNISGIGPVLVDEIRNQTTVGVPVEAITEAPTFPPVEGDAAILSEARKAFDEGNVEAALASYTHLVRKDFQLDQIISDLQERTYRFPMDINIWQTLGDAYVRTDKLQEALEAYTKAEELLR